MDSAAGSRRGVVTATFGRRLGLLLDDGSAADGRVKGKRLQPVCGDRVEVQRLPNEPEWLVSGILPRRNELTRPNQRGRTEVLAANIDALAIVAAEVPKADWFLVDAYLCAAELIGAAAAVVFNKTDLGEPAPASAAELAGYRNIGYMTCRVSAASGAGLAELLGFLGGRTSVLVGQSGVGKSSLLNRLVGRELRPTAGVSRATREGRHKTVNSAMLELGNGGAVIDSPGVREYAPAVTRPTDVSRGFREICEAASACRFANCRHVQEPGCQVKAAVEAGRISPRRYRSYRRMLNAARQLAERYSPSS